MTESDACALLKARFEAAGFHIAENQPFAEAGVSFELDGWDASARVGYEYVTEEAGDGWDVDADVIAKLDAGRVAGELHVLVIDEKDAPDADALEAVAERFLAELAPAAAKPKAKPDKRAGKPAPKKPAPAKPAPAKPDKRAGSSPKPKPGKAKPRAASTASSARKSASRARTGK